MRSKFRTILIFIRIHFTYTTLCHGHKLESEIWSFYFYMMMLNLDLQGQPWQQTRVKNLILLHESDNAKFRSTGYHNIIKVTCFKLFISIIFSKCSCRIFQSANIHIPTVYSIQLAPPTSLSLVNFRPT